jgi:hypothetical protein
LVKPKARHPPDQRLLKQRFTAAELAGGFVENLAGGSCEVDANRGGCLLTVKGAHLCPRQADIDGADSLDQTGEGFAEVGTDAVFHSAFEGLEPVRRDGFGYGLSGGSQSADQSKRYQALVWLFFELGQERQLSAAHQT